METKDLAKQLGISHQLCNRYKKRGMPCDSVEAAHEWRGNNLRFGMTKETRIDGNAGVNRQLRQKNQSSNSDRVTGCEITKDVMTHTIPQLWFEQSGWLAAILKDNGVTITAEQVHKVQACLYMVYMEEVVEYLNESEDLPFYASQMMHAQPEDEIYPSLMARLNQILDRE